MPTRRRSRSSQTDDASRSFNVNLEEDESLAGLDALSDEELEDLLFSDQSDEDSNKGIFNLPTMAGLSLILVGVIYMLTELGLWGGAGAIDLGPLIAMLPVIAGIFIILLGFGILSWRPKKKSKRRVKKTIETSAGKEEVIVEEREVNTKASKSSGSKKRKLSKSRDKKISGVCGGIAEYFNLDPTLVRIAFVIGTIVTSGPPFVIGYFLLSMVMPSAEDAEKKSRDNDPIIIIRDK